MTLEERRREENARLIKMMREGEGFSMVSTKATNFPPRKIIEKDKNALRVLFKEEKDEHKG